MTRQMVSLRDWIFFGYEPEGREFQSPRAHHFYLCVGSLNLHRPEGIPFLAEVTKSAC